MKKNTLEIAIPTYNRTSYLEKCFKSIIASIERVPESQRYLIGISISDNSTKDFLNKEKLIQKYKEIFIKLNINYFNYYISGFNIGVVNNIASALSNTQSSYVWILPDDDVARFDSIENILNAIYKHSPCFIVGGWEQKSKIGYEDDQLKNDNNEANSILSCHLDNEKIDIFLSKNACQLQEYVYKSDLIKQFFSDETNIPLLTPMDPGLYGIYCMQSEQPLVLLKYSVGIFRHDEPNSITEWRHLWPKYTLEDWPELSEKIFKKGWLNQKQLKIAISLYDDLLYCAPYRPDVILGINRKYGLSISKLWYFHRKKYLIAILKSIPAIIAEIIRRISKSK
jgi:hypothetical protein